MKSRITHLYCNLRPTPYAVSAAPVPASSPAIPSHAAHPPSQSLHSLRSILARNRHSSDPHTLNRSGALPRRCDPRCRLRRKGEFGGWRSFMREFKSLNSRPPKQPRWVGGRPWPSSHVDMGTHGCVCNKTMGMRMDALCGH